jgi:hypothetical protein
MRLGLKEGIIVQDLRQLSLIVEELLDELSRATNGLTTLARQILLVDLSTSSAPRWR